MTGMRAQLLFTLLVLSLLAACANIPAFDLRGVDSGLRPDLTGAEAGNARGRTVHWGGTIISVMNLRDSTRIEVLAYRLHRDGRPDADSAALGRFLLIHKGYLETVDYAPGRLISTVGALQEVQEGLVGEVKYTYPVVQAGQLYLWPKTAGVSEPRVRFGIGIGISR